MKRTKFTLKKEDSVIYNEGFVVINEFMMIRKELIILSNKELQEKVDNNEPFYYKYNGYVEVIPPTERLIPQWCDDYKRLKDTNLIWNLGIIGTKLLQCTLLVNEYGITSIDKRYFDFCKSAKLDIYSKDTYNPHVLYDNDIKGLVMPTKVDNEYVDMIKEGLKERV